MRMLKKNIYLWRLGHHGCLSIGKELKEQKINSWKSKLCENMNVKNKNQGSAVLIY